MRQIRFKGEKDNPLKVKRAKRVLKKLIPFIFAVSILTVLALFLTTLSGSNTISFSNLLKNPLKSSSDKVNVLFLGIPGGTHAGATLTDTILVASYNLKTNQVHLISIPRDLWLPALQAKANAVYQLSLNQNNGLNLAKTVMGNILGIPIHYSLMVDFRGFVKAVDDLGGIDVAVEKGFDDYIYPVESKEEALCGFKEEEREFNEEEAKKLNIDPGKRKVLIAPDGFIATDSAEEDKGIKYFTCRYEHIGFKRGLQHMNGTTALKFVRSRHGTNGEGSDFARSKRQELVLQAIRNRMLSLETFFNPAKISELVKTFDKSIDTDISPREALEFYKLSKKLDQSYTLILDDSILVHPAPSNYGGAYVLVSQDDDFSIIHEYVKKILSGEINLDEATAAARRSDR